MNTNQRTGHQPTIVAVVGGQNGRRKRLSETVATACFAEMRRAANGGSTRQAQIPQPLTQSEPASNWMKDWEEKNDK